MRTLEALLNEGIGILEVSGIEEARLDAWLLLEFALQKNRAWYYAHSHETAQEDEAERYLALIKKRAQHIPLQHITHQAFFMGHEFYVDRRALVPRQDTEVLVEEALRVLSDRSAPRILDMCTGSGCILLSLLAEKPGSFGVGADVSADALAVAACNARRLGLEERAVLVESDLFSAEVFHKKYGKDAAEYDILISNPPYIPTGDIPGLMEEVRGHDPIQALDGREDGLYFYRAITAEAGAYLKPGGWLLYEIGADQGAAVSGMLRDAGFEEVAVKKDLAGLDRVVLGRRTNFQEER